jgi:hypothetical protein
MQLQGADDFKATVERLRRFKQNKDKYSLSGIELPNYLWVAKRGGGISTCLNRFTEYLHASRIIEFTGIVKFFEYKLGYIAPDFFFSELTRLNNTISEIAGHYRYFRGIACINIDEWAQHTNETYFLKFLDFIASNNDKVLTVLYVHTGNKRVVEGIESSLASHIRFETVWLRFPEADELVGYIEGKYFGKRGFHFADDAKQLLTESIKTIINGKNFNGFITIKQLSNDILYSLFTSDISENEITAAMLSAFSKDSNYIKRIKSFVGTSSIGFDAPSEEYVK